MRTELKLLILLFLVFAECRQSTFRHHRNAIPNDVLGIARNSTGYYSNGTHCASAIADRGRTVRILPAKDRCLFSNGTHVGTCNPTRHMGVTKSIKRVLINGFLEFDSYDC
jgi:hypothetical protein